MQGNSDHPISEEAFAAAWALESSMGISKYDLSKNAVAVLKDHIAKTEYYGEPTLNGSKGGIELLQAYCTNGNRSGEWLDFIADIIGCTIALAIGTLLVRFLSKQ